MISSLTAGIVLGLSAGLAPGPLLALVITQTLRHSASEGIKVAMSPLVTDVPIILLSVFLLDRVASYREVLGIVSFIGACYVLYLSYESWNTGPFEVDSTQDRPKSLLKGSIVNALNPHPYFFWLTVGGPILLRERGSGWMSPLLFLVCFYVLLIGSKVVLAFIVGRYGRFLRSRYYNSIMRVLGCLLALFALVLFRDAFALIVNSQ